MQQGEMTFKTILLGSPFVGKTSLKNKYIHGQFDYSYNVTVGVQFSSKVMVIHDKIRIKIQLWDTAGQEQFRSLVRSYYHGVCAVLLLFTIQNEMSFLQLKEWVKQIQDHCDAQTIIVLIGTKLDLEQNRKISKQRAQQYLEQIKGSCYFQVSSKTGENIQELFEKIAKILYKKYISSSNFRRLAKPKQPSKEDSSSFNKDMQGRNSILSKNTSKSSTKKKQQCC